MTQSRAQKGNLRQSQVQSRLAQTLAVVSPSRVFTHEDDPTDADTADCRRHARRNGVSKA